MSTRNRPRSRPPFPVRPSVGRPEATEAPRRESDPQEIPFLPRREGRPWTPERVAAHVRLTLEARAEMESQGALSHWKFGDRLLELYNGFAERTQEGMTFEAFAMAAFDLRHTMLYALLRIRHRASRDEARAWGITALLLGFRLMDRLGLETFDALRQRDLPQPDGTTVRFPAPSRRLEAALVLLRAAPEATSPRRVVAETRRRNETLAIARAEDPRLAGVRLKWMAGEKEPDLRISSRLDRDARMALREHLEAVDGD